jgi:hypothetical protein
VNRNGGNPFDCDHVLTSQEIDELADATGEIVTPQNANEINNCLKQCNGDPDCMETCRGEYHQATVDRCTEDCKEDPEALSISPPSATMPCHDASPSLTFSVSGGTAPFSWGATSGTITPSEDGTSATLTPPENPGSGEPGSAYKALGKYGGTDPGDCEAGGANYREAVYGCNDQEISCVITNWFFPCKEGPCRNLGGNSYSCTPLNGLGYVNMTCPGVGVTPPCGSIDICDTRTDPMVAAGCIPCGVMDGTVVSVQDSKGKVALAEVSGG